MTLGHYLATLGTLTITSGCLLFITVEIRKNRAAILRALKGA